MLVFDVSRWRSASGKIVTFLAVFIFFLQTSAQGQIPLVDPTFQPKVDPTGEVYDLINQADGGIVIGGIFSSVSGQSVTNLARLLSNGKLDNSFGMLGADNLVLDLEQQADGKILVSGFFSRLQGQPCIGLGRLLTNGQLDTNFDTGAFFGPNNSPFRLKIKPDGTILVGTIAGAGGRLFQLTTNGDLDPAFTQTNMFNGYWIHSLVVQSNGTILAGGGFNNVNGFASPGLVVLDSSGNVQTSFQSSLANGSDVFSILEQTNGGILIGGIIRRAAETDRVFARMDSNFQWDTNFQTSLFTPYDFSTGPYVRSAILQPDGKIVAGGNFDQVGGYFRRHLVRLNSDGQVDPCFDTGLGLGGSWGVDILTYQPDGRIVIGGAFGVPGMLPNNVARLLPQSDCNATRVYFGTNITPYVAGTSPPGGTNHLQSSTNLIDWVDLNVGTAPILSVPVNVSNTRRIFFRVKKTY
jgi:uncharacterized delta-60 repeat protein